MASEVQSFLKLTKNGSNYCASGVKKCDSREFYPVMTLSNVLTANCLPNQARDLLPKSFPQTFSRHRGWLYRVTMSASLKFNDPLCLVPSISPGPRNSRSFSAISNPSLVAVIILMRSLASFPICPAVIRMQ